MIKIKKSEQAISSTKVYYLAKNDSTIDLPVDLKKLIEKRKYQNRFDDKLGSVLFFELLEKNYFIVNLRDDSSDLTLNDFRCATHNLLTEIKNNKIADIDVYIAPISLTKAYVYKTFAEMVFTDLYVFDKYKKDSKTMRLQSISIIDANCSMALENAILEGRDIAEAINVTRYLVDEPADFMTPKQLAEETKEKGKQYGFEVEVLTEDKIQKLAMYAYLDVAKGSSNKPHLIVMRYKGDKTSEQILGFVGKGLTYDSGGYSIKSHEGLINMKTDMAGAATVIGAMCAIAKAGLEINVTAVVAACENAISGTSYRPGDILTTMSGKTILCENTDAEGRFTLVDALTYIQRNENVNKIIDLATLTGAAVRSLGEVAALTLATDDVFYKLLQSAADDSDEKIWRMPFFKEYDEQIKTDFADFTNIGGNPGAITAGVLLKSFIENNTPWIHMDIAGVVFKNKARGYYKKGATGYGVKTLYELAKKIQR